MTRLLCLIGGLALTSAWAHAADRRTPPKKAPARVPAVPCSESDIPNDPLVFGRVKIVSADGSVKTMLDTCHVGSKGSYLVQWTCVDVALAEPSYTPCDYGCAKGVCLPKPVPQCADSDETSKNPLLVAGSVEVSLAGTPTKKYFDECLAGSPNMIGEKVCNTEHTAYMPTAQPCPPLTACQMNAQGVAYCASSVSCVDHNNPVNLSSNAGATIALGGGASKFVSNVCLKDADPTMAAQLYPTWMAQKDAVVLDLVCLDKNGDGKTETFGTPVAVACPAGQICTNGTCGPKPKLDADGDGIFDDVDNCPAHANVDQKDSDGDKVGDVCDPTPLPPVCGNGKLEVGETCDDGNVTPKDGCSATCVIEKPDQDQDGVIDDTDNCINISNSDQADQDKDGIGDACDACADVASSQAPQPDACAQVNLLMLDSDRDGIEDAQDNCRHTTNADQADGNANAIGDVCEPVAISSHCPVQLLYASEISATDADGNGLYDACEFPKLISHGFAESVGNSGSFAPSVNGNGHAVAFTSVASNLVIDDNGGFQDVFLWSVGAPIKRVSVGVLGQGANGDSRFQEISVDGTTVVLQSEAGNLTPGDGLGANADIFSYDINSAAMTRLSLTGDGCPMAAAYLPLVNANGCEVVFSGPDNIHEKIDAFPPFSALPANMLMRMWRHSRSVGALSAVGNGIDKSNSQFYFRGAISARGELVAFQTQSSLLPSDIGDDLDIYQHNRTTDVLTLISVRPDGKSGNGKSLWPSMSADGGIVVFESIASDLTADDTDPLSDLSGIGAADVYLRDLQSNTTELISLAADGQLFGGLPCGNPDISADGRFVTFTAGLSILSSFNTIQPAEILLRGVYVHDRKNTITRKVANLPEKFGDGIFRNGLAPSISADGRFIAIVTSEAISAEDTNAQRDVYLVTNPLW